MKGKADAGGHDHRFVEMTGCDPDSRIGDLKRRLPHVQIVPLADRVGRRRPFKTALIGSTLPECRNARRPGIRLVTHRSEEHAPRRSKADAVSWLPSCIPEGFR